MFNHPERFPVDAGYTPKLNIIEPERIGEIADRMLGRGWTANEVSGLLGGNNLRVASEVWK